MKTSVLIQSLARWISEIATPMIWICFKAKGKSSQLSEHTNLPFTLYWASSNISLLVRLLSLRFFIPPRSPFFSVWHPEMNRCCHWESCSLSAFKQTVSKRITFTGNLPVWGEVISVSLLCPAHTGRPTLWLMLGIWPHTCAGLTPHHTSVYIHAKCCFDSLNS